MVKTAIIEILKNCEVTQVAKEVMKNTKGRDTTAAIGKMNLADVAGVIRYIVDNQIRNKYVLSRAINRFNLLIKLDVADLNDWRMDAAARGFDLKDDRQLEIYEYRIAALKLPTKNQ